MAEPISLDLTLHGLLQIRVVSRHRADLQLVRRQIGALRQCPAGQEPDITVRFEDNVPLPDLKYLGRDEAGFTDDGYFVLKSKKASARAKIPFDTIGGACEILCQSGLREVPLLIPIVNLSLLKRDCVAVHASAFIYDNTGVLVTGWAKGGKTEALFAFAAEGARYVGDEWIILSRDGEAMYGLGEPMTVWDWHIEQIPSLKRRMTAARRAGFGAIHRLDRLAATLGKGSLKNSQPVRLLSAALPALKRQLHIKVPITEVFAANAIEMQARPEKLFLIMSQAKAGISVEPTSPALLARSMLESLFFEQFPFFANYHAYRFAFPGSGNTFLEGVRSLQEEILRDALRGKEAYRVLHPYPFSFAELARQMAPYCSKASAGTVVPLINPLTAPSAG